MLVRTTSARPPATIAARVVGDSSDHVFFLLFLPRHRTNGTRRGPAERARPRPGPSYDRPMSLRRPREHALRLRLVSRSRRELLLADQDERGEDADRRDARADPERRLEAGGERLRAPRRRPAASVVCAIAIVESTAMPSAPPICCDVLISPDARPASFAVHARERRDRDRHERERHPDRDQQEARQQVAEVRAADRDLREVHEADGEQAIPVDEHRLDADPRHELLRDRRPDDRRARRPRGTRRRSSSPSSRAPAACRASASGTSRTAPCRG